MLKLSFSSKNKNVLNFGKDQAPKNEFKKGYQKELILKSQEGSREFFLSAYRGIEIIKAFLTKGECETTINETKREEKKND